ncbi:MAG: hypothetical protein R2716_06195 [Microthrixaceae bacterium]
MPSKGQRDEPARQRLERLERAELDLDQFAELFEAEALALGHELDGHEVLGCLRGELRPEMVEAIHRLRGRFAIGLLTNNFVTGNPDWSSGGSFAELRPLRRGRGVLGRRVPQAGTRVLRVRPRPTGHRGARSGVPG